MNRSKLIFTEMSGAQTFKRSGKRLSPYAKYTDHCNFAMHSSGALGGGWGSNKSFPCSSRSYKLHVVTNADDCK